MAGEEKNDKKKKNSLNISSALENGAGAGKQALNIVGKIIGAINDFLKPDEGSKGQDGNNGKDSQNLTDEDKAALDRMQKFGLADILKGVGAIIMLPFNLSKDFNRLTGALQMPQGGPNNGKGQEQGQSAGMNAGQISPMRDKPWAERIMPMLMSQFGNSGVSKNGNNYQMGLKDGSRIGLSDDRRSISMDKCTDESIASSMKLASNMGFGSVNVDKMPQSAQGKAWAHAQMNELEVTGNYKATDTDKAFLGQLKNEQNKANSQNDRQPTYTGQQKNANEFSDKELTQLLNNHSERAAQAGVQDADNSNSSITSVTKNKDGSYNISVEDERSSNGKSIRSAETQLSAEDMNGLVKNIQQDQAAAWEKAVAQKEERKYSLQHDLNRANEVPLDNKDAKQHLDEGSLATMINDNKDTAAVREGMKGLNDKNDIKDIKKTDEGYEINFDDRFGRESSEKMTNEAMETMVKGIQNENKENREKSIQSKQQELAKLNDGDNRNAANQDANNSPKPAAANYSPAELKSMVSYLADKKGDEKLQGIKGRDDFSVEKSQGGHGYNVNYKTEDGKNHQVKLLGASEENRKGYNDTFAHLQSGKSEGYNAHKQAAKQASEKPLVDNEPKFISQAQQSAASAGAKQGSNDFSSQQRADMMNFMFKEDNVKSVERAGKDNYQIEYNKGDKQVVPNKFLDDDFKKTSNDPEFQKWQKNKEQGPAASAKNNAQQADNGTRGNSDSSSAVNRSADPRTPINNNTAMSRVDAQRDSQTSATPAQGNTNTQSAPVQQASSLKMK